jgi:hypothetical protein
VNKFKEGMNMKNDFILKFKELHEKLLKDTEVKVISFAVHPPLSEKELKSLALNEELHDLYATMNGCQLSYIYTNNEEFDAASFVKFSGSFSWDWPQQDYWQLDGCVNLIPIDIMMQQSWEELLWYKQDAKYTFTYKNKVMNKLEFTKKIKPFDLYSKSTDAVIYCDEADVDVLLGIDHNASFDEFPPITLEKYLNGVIATAAKIDRRKEIFMPNEF